MELIRPNAVETLVSGGVISQPVVKTDPGGFYIQVTVGHEHRALGTARRGLRVFKTLDAAANVLVGYGITSFACELNPDKDMGGQAPLFSEDKE